MKSLFNRIVLALILTLGSACAQAQNNPKSVETYDGTWTISERNCSDGKPANDRYDLTRDSMILTLNANRGVLEVRIDGETQTARVGLDPLTEKMNSQSSDGKWQQTPFQLLDAETLIFISEGFGPGGSCAIGQKLYSTFKKTN